MPCTLNKEAWEKLIDEDIFWLDNQPDTLEAKHIRQILEWIKTHRQLDLTERLKKLEVIKRVDDEMFYDIRKQYPRTADLQAKIDWREKKVEQALEKQAKENSQNPQKTS